MSPTLYNGELLLVDRVSMYIRMPQRGEMVTFSHPQTGEELIKRVVGLPGETVEIAGGHVYIDGRLLDESSYIPALAARRIMPPSSYPATPCFVLGDDRAASMDSRDPAVGCVKLSKIDGIVRLRVSPLTRAAVFL
jgi:signal peptidase I